MEGQLAEDNKWKGILKPLLILNLLEYTLLSNCFCLTRNRVYWTISKGMLYRKRNIY